MTPGARRQLPRDLVDEIERELVSCSQHLTDDSRRATALLELHAEAGATAVRVGRPLTVFEYLDDAAGPRERARRAAQLRQLRAHDAWPEPCEEPSARVDGCSGGPPNDRAGRSSGVR